MRNTNFIDALPFSLKPIIDITDTLPQKPNPNPMRTPDQFKYIAVHHSAVEGGTIQGYANYHVNTKGWPCIGYHMVIKGDQTFQTNDLLTFSYHVASNNAHTVSVSVSGDLSKRPLSELERNNLYGVILTYMSLFNIPVEKVLGHDEFPGQNTACPCIDMNKVRSDIHSLQLMMELIASRPDRVKRAMDATNRIISLYNKSKDPDDKFTDTALDKMDQIYGFLVEKKLLNP